MLKASLLKRYRDAVAGRPWLRVVETSITQVPEKLSEIDPDLFVAFNVQRMRFEVHDAAVPAEAFTYVLSGDLDNRLTERVWDARHDRDPFGRADRWAKAEKDAQQRQRDNQIAAIAGELADAVRYDTDGRKSFAIGK